MKIRSLCLNLAMEIYSKVFFLKNKDYYITSMSHYADLTVDVKKLLQFDKTNKIPDLANAILAGGVDFGYKKTLYEQRLTETAMHLKLIKETEVNT